MYTKLVSAFVALVAFSGTATAAGTCSLPKIADSVAMKPVPGSDLVTVPVGINGTQKQFLLDYSTNPPQISQAAVNELGLLSSSKGSQNLMYGVGDLASGPLQEQAPVYDARGSTRRGANQTLISVHSFTLGRATGHDMQFIVSNDPDMRKSKPYDGLLTNSFFGDKYDVELDFGGKKIYYLTPTKCTDPNQVVFWSHAAIAVVPMTMVNGRIQVPVTIEGHTINAILDTSSERTVMRRSVADQVFGLKANTPDMMPAGNLVDGMGVQVYQHTFPQIAFEGVVAKNVPALITANRLIRNSDRAPLLGTRANFASESRIPDLTLGMDVLHQLHLYIVPGQKKMYVTAAR